MAEGNVKRDGLLECREHIGRNSPELWPEQLPGAWDMWKSVKIVPLHFTVSLNY